MEEFQKGTIAGEGRRTKKRIDDEPTPYKLWQFIHANPWTYKTNRTYFQLRDQAYMAGLRIAMLV